MSALPATRRRSLSLRQRYPISENGLSISVSARPEYPMNERRNPRTARAPLPAVVAKEPFTFSLTLKCRAEQAAAAFKWWVALRVDLSGKRVSEPPSPSPRRSSCLDESLLYSALFTLAGHTGLPRWHAPPGRSATRGLCAHVSVRERVHRPPRYLGRAGRCSRRYLHPTRRRQWRRGQKARILGVAQPGLSDAQEPQGTLRAAEYRRTARDRCRTRANHADQ